MKLNSNESAGLPELHTQMRITNRLLAAQLKREMPQNQLISLLATTGASHQEIAQVLDTSSDVVAVTIHRRKNKKR